MQQSNAGISVFIRSIVFSYLNKIVLLVLGLLYIFVLANALGPESFGKYSYIMEFGGSLLALLGLETAAETVLVFIPKTNSAQLIRRVLFFQALVSILVAGFFLFFSGSIVDWLGESEPALTGWLALVLLLLPVSTIVSAIATANRQFGKLFLLSLVENVGNLLFVLLFVVFFQGGLVGAIIGRTIALVVLAFFSIGLLKQSYDSKPLSNPEKTAVVSYSKQSFVTGIFKKAAIQANLVFLGTFVSAAALGLFYIAQKISRYLLEIPVVAMNEVLLPFASKENDLEKIERMVSKNAKFYVILSTVFSIVLVFLGPVLVSVLFPSYGDSTVLFLLFGVYYVFLIDYSLGTFFRVINRPQVLTIMNALVLVNTVAAGYFLIGRFGAEGYLLTLILNRMVALLVFFLDIRKHKYRLAVFPTWQDATEFFRIFQNVLASGVRLVKKK